MVPNPFSGLLHSRKVWLAVVDAIAAILALWIGAYVEPKLAQLILATWAALQPVIIAVIVMIAVEDRGNVAAAAKVEEAEIRKLTTLAQVEACKANGASEVVPPTQGECCCAPEKASPAPGG